MRPVAVYSALRLGLFLLALLALRVLGVGGVLSVVIALVVAMLLSFVVLRRQRDAVTMVLMERKKGRGAGATAPAAGSGTRGARPRAGRRPRSSFAQRIADDAAAEDAVLDERAPARPTDRPQPGTTGDDR